MPFASWTAPASVESVAQLRQAVVDFAYQHGVAEPCLSDIRLAVSEAVTNAVVHAFRGRADGTVIASVTTGASEWVEVRVSDDGSGMAPRNDSPGIGLGLPLIRHLTDQFEHRRPPGSVGTELRMRFRLALARVPDPSHPPPTQPALAATATSHAAAARANRIAYPGELLADVADDVLLGPGDGLAQALRVHQQRCRSQKCAGAGNAVFGGRAEWA